MSLTRLYSKQQDLPQLGHAHEKLGSIYNSFSEGFDTADLCEAKLLLETNSQKQSSEQL